MDNASMAVGSLGAGVSTTVPVMPERRSGRGDQCGRWCSVGEERKEVAHAVRHVLAGLFLVRR